MLTGQYDRALVLISVLVAVFASYTALSLAERVSRSERPAALRWIAGGGFAMGTGNFSLTQLAALVIVGALGVLSITLLATIHDARMDARTEVLAATEEVSRERQRLLDSERALRAEAERLSAVKDQFLATLSHELRTPLNTIVGWVQVLQIKSDAGSLKTGLETIERNAWLQARLIDDLLDMSRIISGQVRLERNRVDLGALAQAAVDAARPAAAAKAIALHCDAAPLGGHVEGDAVRLQQVLSNLLSNAVKFTPAHGRVDVRVRAVGERAELSVEDNGIGIAPEFLGQVFERFRQADSSTTRRHGGLGLGLAIAPTRGWNWSAASARGWC